MKITLPQSWDQVTIRQFTELIRVKEREMEPLETAIQLIAILSGEDYSEVSKLSLDSIRKAYAALSFIDSMDFPDKIEEYLEFDGVKYTAKLDIRKITAGQYIDLKDFTKDKDAMYNIHNIMAVLYIPNGKQYNDIPQSEVAEVFYEKMPITIAYSVAVFFCNLLSASMRDIKVSLDKEMIAKIMKIKV
jgi:hypothetical protein